MATAYIQKPEDDGAGAGPLGIDKYKNAQDRMLRAISAMDDLTSSPSPDALRLSHTRLRITRMSKECRRVYQEVAKILSQQRNSQVNSAINELDVAHFELAEITSLHLARWAPQEILTNWNAYCRASAEVRRRWRQIIERERQLLFPLLPR